MVFVVLQYITPILIEKTKSLRGQTVGFVYCVFRCSFATRQRFRGSNLADEEAQQVSTALILRPFLNFRV